MLSQTRLDFESHWCAHSALEICSAKESEARGFLQPVLERIEQGREPLYILDVGCGDGVHAVVLAQSKPGRCFSCGIDISTKAVRLARRRLSAIQGTGEFQTGNALALPYRAASFDIVLAYGMLAYTGEPEKALDEIWRVCKRGGLIGVWVYPQVRGVGGALFKFTRAICRWLGPQRSKVIVYAVVLLLPVLPVRSGANLFNASWQQCVEVVEVNLVPETLEFFTPDQVLDWFHKRNLHIERIDSDRPIAVWARV